MKKLFAAVSIVLGLACLALAEELPYRPVEAFPALRFENPLFIAQPRDGADRFFVVEQGGRVLAFDKDADKADVALDIKPKIRLTHNEEGLLGLAFHPRFKSNNYVFLFYSVAKSNPRRSRVSRFTYDPGRGVIDPASEKKILEVRKMYGNHNGGMIEFGPDGYLYVSLGDGGGQGDPQSNGQNTGTLLGKILRINVDRSADGKPYAIPLDNPLLADPAARPEIWAYGFRNVWRFSFDRETGALWAGDVGERSWEEIDIVKKGGNYGWNVREGKHPFKETGEKGPFIEPVLDLGRGDAQSVTGGYVYRGKRLKDLTGAYIYGDFMTGKIWALRYDGKKAEQEQIAQGELISSFGEDREGEIYFTSYDGKVYTLERKP